MANESPSTDMRNVWQSQKSEGSRMSVEDIHRKAEKFEKRVFWENALNYFLLLAGVVLINMSLYLTWHRMGVLLRLGFCLVLVALPYMIYQTHKRSPSRRVPSETGLVSCVQFHRKELERRRDLHRSVWRWGLGPPLPGCIVLMMGIACLRDGRHSVRDVIAFSLMFDVSVVLAFAWAWRESQLCARRLQDQIDELDALQVQR